MIRAEGLTKYFHTGRGRHYVLRKVSFEIGPRAQVGLLGRNGAGKTTLLRLLAGVDAPNRGRVIREGKVSWPIGIANCVQALMTGRENTRFACRIQGLTYDEMPPIIDFVESFADIGKYFDMPVRVYSSGMRARLGFAITMAFDFDFYILDEVTATGDKAFKEKARQMFEEKRRRSAFIRASHNFRELLSECDSGLVLHEGKLEHFAAIEQAVERYLELIEPTGKPGRAPGKAAEKWRRSRGGKRPDKEPEGNRTAAPPAPAAVPERQHSASRNWPPIAAKVRAAEPLHQGTGGGSGTGQRLRAGDEPGARQSSRGDGSGMPVDRLFGLRRQSRST